MTIRSLALAIPITMTISSPIQAAPENPEDARFKALFQEHLEDHLQSRPLLASAWGDHRFDSQVEDLSKPARERWTASDRAMLERLDEEISYDQLSRDGQIDFEIFRHELEERIWSAESLRPYEEDPRTWSEILSGSVYRLLTQSSLDPETNISNAIARMKLLPEVVAEARRSLEHPPLPILETGIKQQRGVISFYREGLYELVGDSPQLPALRAAAEALLPSLDAHLHFLEGEVRERATEDWRLGKDRFNRKLRFQLNADRSADEVLADAESEFARVSNEMYVVARQLWHRTHPGRALPPDDPEGRRETIASVLAVIGREHGKPEHLERDARGTVERLKRFIQERDVLRLPDPDRCEIIEMPEFRRGNSLAYIQPAPPLDPGNKTIYAISPPPSDWSAERVESFLQEYNRHMLQILTIHEAYPGHYVQLEYSNREPSLVRRLFKSGVFVEGWAVYTEQMMLDEGYGEGDLALRLTQLKFYLRAVANAILDHRMHCTGMTDEEALDLLMNRAFQEEGEARLKIIRAKQSSVQLSTYFVGRMALYRLRQAVQREMGDDFHLGRYHEAVMDNGSVPVQYLPELVRRRLAKPR